VDRETELAKRREYYHKNKERIRKRWHEYRLLNRDKINAQKKVYYNNSKQLHFERAKDYQRRLRREVLAHYSHNLICQLCGKEGIEFLTMDHINGRKQGEKLKAGRLYGWLKKNKYPLGFQVLCWNCNAVKYIYGDQQLKFLLK